MPIKPHPIIWSCPSCGWSKTVAPRSDALAPGEHYDACPKCGEENLKAARANDVLAGVAELAGKLRQILR